MKENIRRFNEAKFGMFIHWGPEVSRDLRHEYEHPDSPEKLLAWTKQAANQFNAENYNPRSWMRLARETGIKYAVLTTIHGCHYPLWDCKDSDFSAVKMGPGRDLIREYVDACRQEGILVGFYYNLYLYARYFAEKGIPWPKNKEYLYLEDVDREPQAFKKIHELNCARLHELLTNYGKIDQLWLDATGLYRSPRRGIIEMDEFKELSKMVRNLQPEIMLCDNEPMKGPGQKGYFFTDRAMKTVLTSPSPVNECSWTLSETLWWHFAEQGGLISPKEIIFNLIECACKQSNFLLNVSPRLDGLIPDDQLRILREVGKWLALNGKAIYGVNGQNRETMITSSSGRFTIKDDRIYFYVINWPLDGEIIIGGINKKIRNVYILSSSEKVNFSQIDERLFITNLPKKAPDEYCSVIVLDQL